MHSEEIENKIFKMLLDLLEDKSIKIDKDTSLIGEGSLLDSMKLVELCLLLEDKALDIGFEFDWTSEEALSKSQKYWDTIDEQLYNKHKSRLAKYFSFNN